MARKLADIRIVEVSLVDHPANKRKFAFFKRGLKGKVIEMDKGLKEQLEKLLGRELSEDEISKSTITDDDVKVLSKHFDTLLRYKDDLCPAVISAIADVSCRAVLAKEVGGSADEAKESEEKAADGTVADLVDQIVERTMEKFTEVLNKQFGELAQKLDSLGSKKESGSESDDDEEVEEADFQKMMKDELEKRGIKPSE